MEYFHEKVIEVSPEVTVTVQIRSTYPIDPAAFALRDDVTMSVADQLMVLGAALDPTVKEE